MNCIICKQPGLLEYGVCRGCDYNARQAATEMLLALRAIVFAARDGAVLERDAVWAQAKTAIAKATGPRW